MCANWQESVDSATPGAMKVPRNVAAHPPASAFRNVSYQRATHESLLGDSAVNQSPVVSATDGGHATAAFNTDSEIHKTTVDNSEVRGLITKKS